MKENTSIRNATNLKLGESSIIEGFDTEEFSAKFLEIGCLPKASIKLIRRGPAGKTVYLQVNGNAFAFREEEASHIILKY